MSVRANKIFAPLLLLTCILMVSKLIAQPDTLWTRAFGGANLDWFHDVKCTPDGGYIAVGETWSLPGHDVDWYVVKTDSQGHPEWAHTFGGIYDDRAQSVVLTEDGGYTIAGWISGDTSRYGDFALVHLNASGDSIWGRVTAADATMLPMALSRRPTVAMLWRGLPVRSASAVE